MKSSLIIFSFISLAFSSAVSAATVTVTTNYDRWMYPFTGTGGTRGNSSTFGAPTMAGFDDRDAQVMLGFSTGALVAPAGTQLVITKATVTANNLNAGWTYDPTPDDFTTLNGTVADSDAGRAIELFGIGYRNGRNATNFGENAAFTSNMPSPLAGGSAYQSRDAFVSDYENGVARDVSNNVREGYNADSFATGLTNLNPGALVGANQSFSFDIDLADPDALAYLMNGASAGNVFFGLSSFTAAVQNGPTVFPGWEMKENNLDNPTAPASLFLEYSFVAVPEPSRAALVGLSSLFLLTRRVRRRKASI